MQLYKNMYVKHMNAYINDMMEFTIDTKHLHWEMWLFWKESRVCFSQKRNKQQAAARGAVPLLLP